MNVSAVGSVMKRMWARAILYTVLIGVCLSCSEAAPERTQRKEVDLGRFADSVMRAYPPDVLRTLPDSTVELLWLQTQFDFGDSLKAQEWKRVLDSVNTKALSRSRNRSEEQKRTERAAVEAANRRSRAAELSQALQTTRCKNPSRERARRGLEQGHNGSSLEHIACQSVHIGMTADEARASWGRPNDINRTTHSFGVHEQWVYGEMGERGILYFEDGVLTTIQN